MNRKFSWLRRLFLSLLVGILLILTLTIQGKAQSLFELSETELVFKGLVGETLQRTVTIIRGEEPVLGLQYIISDLVDPATKNVILSEQISLNPSDLSDLEKNQVLTVTISGTQKHGNYSGDIRFFVAEQGANQSVALKLQVEVNAVPMVDADVYSKNPTLFVEPTLLDMPFGRPELTESSPTLGEVVLSLVQSGDSPARILNAKVLSMQSAQGKTLPENVVRVETNFPLELAARDAATIRILAKGRNLPAGDYNGTLLVNVENQPGPVQIPLKVQVKDGPILAFILLGAGPLVGVLFFYWNKDGKNLLETQRRIRRLQSILKSGKLLTIQDQQQIKIKLDSIMDDILNQGDLTEVANRLTELDEFIKGQQSVGEQYLGTLQSLMQRLEALSVGKVVRDQMFALAKELGAKIEAGDSSSWEAVQRQIDQLQTQITELDQAIEEVQAIEGEKRAILIQRMNEARDLDELKSVAVAGRSIIPKKLAELFMAEEVGSRPDWQRFSLVLQWRRLAVAAVVYFFTLAVGWITLYASSPTFGANREDYITLFLWGVASNVVGGQTVDLKSILTRSGESTQEPGP